MPRDKMITYNFKEVMDFLRENPDKEFDYTKPCLNAPNEEGQNCLMASFFIYKGFSPKENYSVSYNGDTLYLHQFSNGKRRQAIAEVVDGPEHIGDFHMSNSDKTLQQLERAGYK